MCYTRLRGDARQREGRLGQHLRTRAHRPERGTCARCGLCEGACAALGGVRPPSEVAREQALVAAALHLEQRQQQRAAAKGLPLGGGLLLLIEACATVVAHPRARALQRARGVPPHRLIRRACHADAVRSTHAGHAHLLALVAEVHARAALLVAKPVDRVADAVHLHLDAQEAVAMRR